MTVGGAPILTVRRLVKHFPLKKGMVALGPRRLVKAVDGVDLDLHERETLAVVGESGCGKSTLARLVLRLVEPTSGAIAFEGRDILKLGGGPMRRLRRHMQMVFQDPFGSLNPRMTVGRILAEPLALHGLATGSAARARVAELLRIVGLAPDHAGRYPHEFSGGQRQRIGIARALAVSPRLVVGDEPVSALDVSVQAQIINLLQDLKARFGLSYIIIAHDLTVVKHMADRVAVMYLGRIVETAPTEALFGGPRHPYTQALLSAIPVPDPKLKRERLILQGDVPSPVDPPPGCHFHTRCPHARERCRVESPALVDDAGDRHPVACHYWREIEPTAGLLRLGSGRVATSVRLQRRLDAYAARRRTKAAG